MTRSEAIDTFRPYAIKQGWQMSQFATNECEIASHTFIKYLRSQGIYGKAVTLKAGVDTYPPYSEWEWFAHQHMVVRVGDTLVDWTARQFDEDLPFPTLWVTKLHV